MLNKLNKWLVKFDSFFPNPWYVEGVKQGRPVTQLGFLLGVGLTILFLWLFT